MEQSPALIEGHRRTIGRVLWLGLVPVLAVASTYLAARSAGPWAAGLASGLWSAMIGLSWALRASRLREAVLHYSEQARADDLTGLGNNRSFRDGLHRHLQEARPELVSLILIDVDCFKSFNDTFGHPAGDEALRALGAVLRANSPKSSRKYRLGGDEFAVFLPGAGLEQARLIAEGLRAAIEAHPWPLRPITASLGVASATGDEADPLDLHALADRALYRSKGAGRNRVTDQRPG